MDFGVQGITRFTVPSEELNASTPERLYDCQSTMLVPMNHILCYGVPIRNEYRHKAWIA